MWADSVCVSLARHGTRLTLAPSPGGALLGPRMCIKGDSDAAALLRRNTKIALLCVGSRTLIAPASVGYSDRGRAQCKLSSITKISRDIASS